MRHRHSTHCLSRRAFLSGTVAAGAASLLPWPGRAPLASAAEAPRTGGVLKVAIIGEPPTLDAHWTTATLTHDVAWHLYEPLFTLDENYGVIPMLAEGHSVSEGGKLYT